MKITAALFEAYLKCPTKCYLYSRGETGSGNAYDDWSKTRTESYRSEGIQRLKAKVPPAECSISPPTTENPKRAKWKLAVDLVVSAKDLETAIHAVQREPPRKPGQGAQLVSIRFIAANKLTKDDRMLVVFDALVLSKHIGRVVRVGKIIHGDDDAVLKVKVAPLVGTVEQLTEKVAALVSGDLPPDLVLNRHCGECEFQTRCRQKATEKDDLSLLSSLCEKERTH